MRLFSLKGNVFIDEIRFGGSSTEVTPQGSFFGGNLGLKYVDSTLPVYDGFYPYVFVFNEEIGGWWWFHQNPETSQFTFIWSFELNAWLWKHKDFNRWIYVYEPYNEWVFY